MAQSKKPIVMIAGGGTGGHVYPALAIAHALKKKNPEIDIHFVGTVKGIETKLVTRENFPLHFLPVSGLKNLSLLARLKGVLLIPLSIFKSAQLVLSMKPQFVLGVGGYASGPFLLASALLGRKTAIWEPNAFPGLTNRILSPFVDMAFVVFEASQEFLKTKKMISLGMPLRAGIEAHPREVHSSLRVLIFGGSLGARGINTTVSEAVVRGGKWLEGVEIVHQTGATDFEVVKQKYESAGSRVDVQPFLYDMQQRYAWADLVFCRSGASTVAEIASAQKAAVFIPFPQAADDHQKKNAEILSQNGAAVLVVQKEFTPQKFIELVEYYKEHPADIQKLQEKVKAFHRPNASEVISDIILGEIKGTHP
ncbi:MAG: undecaprenyldiphospho-muramoylpentapeptide beta-N-acetylglucosaminyltransferase [Bdellovibrionales bacterium]